MLLVQGSPAHDNQVAAGSQQQSLSCAICTASHEHPLQSHHGSEARWPPAWHEAALVGGAGRAMEDGTGVLPDGTRYERVSGEEKGPNG